MARALVDLDARASVLDAAERLATAPPDGDVALVVAAGAPVLRSGVFLEVLRTQVGPRRLSLVTTDPRARSVASSVHVPAYASLAALERHELDPTERLEKARRAAIASTRPGTVSAPRPSLRRVGAIAASLAAAAAILAAVVLPEATVIVSAAAQPIAAEVTVRGTTGGSADVTLKTVTQPIAAKIPGAATGVRTEELKARGALQLQNKTTADVRIPKGSVFQTSAGIQFLSMEDRNLPRSVIIPGTAFELFIGKVDVPVEAAVAGTSGNVASGRITTGTDPRYTVTNPEPTAGGEIRRIPVVRIEDYDAAQRKAGDALKAAGEEQVARWRRERPGEQIVPQPVRQTQLAPAPTDVVGKEGFELTVSGVATAYVAPEAELRRAVAGRLREQAETGSDVGDSGLLFDVKGVTVVDDGVTWAIAARGQQTRRVDRAHVARLLAARSVRDTESLLTAERLRLVRLDWVPAWSPILPLLDTRISVQVQQ